MYSLPAPSQSSFACEHKNTHKAYGELYDPTHIEIFESPHIFVTNTFAHPGAVVVKTLDANST